MRYKVTVQYHGGAYFGWQKQVSERTIQGEIETRLSQIFNQEITIHASGRTDAKVHARGQVFHFDGPPFSVRKLKYALNRMLPKDIEILSIIHVGDDFHARFSAKEKTYCYVIVPKQKDPFLSDKVLFYPFPLDIRKIRKAAKQFIGTHDFSNFTSKPEDEALFLRAITKVSVRKVEDDIHIMFTGNGFMRGQIRFMVGTLLALNEGKIADDYISLKLSQKHREIVPFKVPGDGLYLLKVLY